MPGKPSQKMLKTMELIQEGITPYAAAKQTGIHLNTMYRSALYKEWNAGKVAAGERVVKQRPSKELMNAMRHIKRGIPVADAAARAKINRCAVYQSKVYRKWKENGAKLDLIA